MPACHLPRHVIENGVVKIKQVAFSIQLGITIKASLVKVFDMIRYAKRPLCTALAGLGTLAAMGPTQAVNVSADGRGEVLLYPFYTVRADGAGNAYNTLLSVVNANASAKAVRVRFLEGRNSREVLDFNLFLSPFDVWTAAVLPDPDTGGARVGTVDRSCTLPAFSASPTAPFVPFGNFTYAGTKDEGAGR